MKDAKSKALREKSHSMPWSAMKNARKCHECKKVFKTEEELDKHWH